ncbi:PucR family transcriptional regulator [Actinospica durhamensis]|uniref:PucR family transcriptional regulator n=1 Tax=Actinospica durhamensis TaxID=1508375 RepID=UPI000554F043|nr:helix-turn-helix domain-containing protein [Actinospica durhamensis]
MRGTVAPLARTLVPRVITVTRRGAVCSALADLARRLLAHNDELAAELARRVAQAETDLADGFVVPFEDLEAACTTLQAGLYRYLAGLAPLDLPSVTALGRRRAEQGVPLPAVLHGLRIGFQYVWESLAGAVDPEDRDAVGGLLGQVTDFWTVLDDFSTELRRAYNEAVAARVRIVEAERDAHVEALLGLTAAEPSRQSAGAEALGLARHGRYQVGVLDASASAAPWQAHLSARRIQTFWHAGEDRLVCLASLSSLRADRDLLEVLPGDASVRMGLSPVFGDITAAGTARHRATIALRSIPTARTGIRRYGDDPLATLLASAPETAVELADRIIGPLLQLPEIERTLLLETLQAWIAAGGATGEAARTVYCHRNTVRYRLRRIEELIGCRVAEPRHVTLLCMAMEVIAQYGLRPSPS